MLAAGGYFSSVPPGHWACKEEGGIEKHFGIRRSSLIPCPWNPVGVKSCQFQVQLCCMLHVSRDTFAKAR